MLVLVCITTPNPPPPSPELLLIQSDNNAFKLGRLEIFDRLFLVLAYVCPPEAVGLAGFPPSEPVVMSQRAV